MVLSSVWKSANTTLVIGGPMYELFDTVNETDVFLEIKNFFDIAERKC